MGSSLPFGVSIPGNRASPQTSSCALPPTPPTMTGFSPYATNATFPSTPPPPAQRSYVPSGLPGNWETASFRRAYVLRHGGHTMEGSHYRQVVAGEVGIGAHLGGVGGFRGAPEENVV